jgi:hypothetical protein
VAGRKRNKAAARQRESEVAATASRLAFFVFVTTSCATVPAKALDPRYPDWPCQQLKVPGISIASVWTGPPIDSVEQQQLAELKDSDLAARLAARRTPMDEARKLIEGFLAGAGPAKQARATALFAELYSILDAQRSEVMNGIERFSHKEKAMAEDIRAKTRKLQQLQDAANGNQTEIDDLANQLAWETRIFEDRRKSTSYVCEVPVLIEKRLFDLGRAIQDAANVNPGAN